MDPVEGARRVMMHAVSETVGAIILISIAALAMSIVMLVLLASPVPTHVPAFSGLISNSSNTVYISHEGGDPLYVGQFKVLVDGLDKTTLFTQSLTSNIFSLGMKMNATLTPMPKSVVLVFDTSGGGGTILLSVDLTSSTVIPSGTGKLTVTKIVVNDNGGTKQVSDFPLKVDGAVVISGVQNSINAGIHTVSETSDFGYTESVSGDCAPDGSITLNWGNVKSCTITNNDIQPKLTVTKIVINDNGGIKQVSDFPLKVDGTGVTSGVQNGFDAGFHTVSETSDPNYFETITGDCAADGSITLYPGDVKACTITNDDMAMGPVCSIG